MRESHSWTKSDGGTRADPEEKFVAHNSHFYVLSERNQHVIWGILICCA